MRVAIVSESFLPQVNGVTNTVRHVVDHLGRSGHQALVVAPGPGPLRHGHAEVVRTRALAMPGYRSFPVGLPDPVVDESLAAFGPDVVHLASPIALGAVGLRAARRLGVPTVAVFQTDISGFARQYGVRADHVVDRWVARLHRRCDRTLVPSQGSWRQLAALVIPGLHLWRRGVSLDLFGPERRDTALHATWRGGPGRVVVGYVGRLAAEKQVRRLAEVADLPGVQLVVVGDGPERAWLHRRAACRWSRPPRSWASSPVGPRRDEPARRSRFARRAAGVSRGHEAAQNRCPGRRGQEGLRRGEEAPQPSQDQECRGAGQGAARRDPQATELTPGA